MGRLKDNFHPETADHCRIFIAHLMRARRTKLQTLSVIIRYYANHLDDYPIALYVIKKIGTP